MAATKEYPLAIVIRTVDKATADIRKLNAQLGKIAKKVEDVGRSMTTGITLPVIGMGVASTAAFAQFEKGMSNVSTLIDTNVENIGEMGKEVRAMGRRVGVPLEQLTGGLYDVRSAGVAAENAMGVLEKSARLGVAGLGSTQESVDLVTSSINAFALQGEDADRVYDQIFKTVKNGKTTIAGLSQGFGGVAGTVAATGTKLDEYLASVAALTTTGLPAAEAHTQLKAVMSGLTRETDDTRKVFRKLGAKDLKDLIAKSGGLVPALERIKGALKGNEGQMLKLFGSTEALNAVLGLTGAQNTAFKNTLLDMREGANAVDVAFEKQNATMMARWQRLKNTMMSAGISIGETLAPALEKVAAKLQTVGDWVSGLDESTRTWLVTTAAIVATLGPVIMGLGKFGKAITNISSAVAVIKETNKAIGATSKVAKVMTGALGWIGKSFKALGMFVAANPIVLAIAAIAIAAALIYKYWDPIKAFFVRLWDGIKVVFAQFWNWAKGVLLSFGPIKLIAENWDLVKDYFKDLWDGVTAVFAWAWSQIKPIVDKVVDAVDLVKQGWETLRGSEQSALPNLMPASGGFAGGLPMSLGAPISGQARSIVAANELRRGGAENGETKVRVEFANAPRGTRVDQESRGASVDLAVGYQMGSL